MNNIRGICISLSLFIHFAAIGYFGAGEWIQNIIPVIPKPQSTEVALKFVDTPDQFKEEPIMEKESQYISDKSKKAQDMDETEKVVPSQTKSKEITDAKQLAKISKSIPKPTVPEQQKQVEKKKEEMKKLNEAKQYMKYLEETEKSGQNKQEKTVPPAEEQIQAFAGKDAVDLPEISEDLFSAPEKDIPSFEAQYHKIGPYFKELKGKIETYWLGYLVFRYQNTAPMESETTVSFKVMPSGDVADVEAIEYYGDILFRDFCVATVSNAAPYPPLPEDIDDLKEDGGLKVYFSFRYR